jgi:hypothetical protein
MSEDDPEDLKEAFLDRMAAYESREPKPLLDALAESGVILPAPEELDDAQIGAKLWELIHGLALFGTFLHCTDHLSDRELYTELWREELREPAVLMPEDTSFGYHIDMVGSGSEEHIHLYLKHYADERTRQSWKEDWPGDEIPEHEDPPYDRDRRLPQRKFRTEDDPVM